MSINNKKKNPAWCSGVSGAVNGYGWGVVRAKEDEDGRSAAVSSPVVGTRGIACTNSREDCAIVAAVELGPFVHV